MENQLNCSICSKKCKSILALKYHKRYHEENLNFKCGLCNRRFVTKNAYQRHQNKHEKSQSKNNEEDSKENLFNCSLCSISFKSKKALDVHRQSHEDNVDLKCKVCNKWFVTSKSFKRHMIEHYPQNQNEHPIEKPAEEDLATCSICHKPFISKSALAIHAKIHEENYNFKCKICDFRFVTKKACKKHQCVAQNQEQNDEQKCGKNNKFICSICSTSFKSKKALGTHIKWHLENIKFECEVCKKRFVTEKSLKRHRREHYTQNQNRNDEYHAKENFSCSICSRIFKSKLALAIHSKSHAENLKFQCEICKNRFVTKKAYRSHQNQHKGDVSSFQNSQVVDNENHDQENVFYCSICSISFKSRLLLAYHKRNHQENLKFKCLLCNVRFVTKLSYTRHLNKHKESQNKKNQEYSKEKKFKCSICSILLKSKISLGFHKRLHKVNLKFECEVCKKRFITKRGYRSHCNMHMEEFSAQNNKEKVDEMLYNENLFSCSVCSLKFKSKLLLAAHHNKFHAVNESIQCDVCNRRFVTREAFERHQNEHLSQNQNEEEGSLHVNDDEAKSDKENPFHCSICSTLFKSKLALTHHSRFHEENLNFKCELCNMRFVTKDAYRVHRNKHDKQINDQENETNSKRNSFTCSICSISFKSKVSLSLHSRFHEENFKFECEVCNKCFCTKLSYKRHQKIHFPQKSRENFSLPIEYDICETLSSSKVALPYDKEIHKEDYQFCCMTCQKSFSSKPSLRKHEDTHKDKIKISMACAHKSDLKRDMQVHSGIKLFYCSKCNSSFTRKQSLIVHERAVHQAIKEHVCSYCQKAFSRSGGLRRHLKPNKEQDDGDNLSCSKCTLTFNSKCQLRMHSVAHSAENSEKQSGEKIKWFCAECNIPYSNRTSYQLHLRVHKRKPFICTKCLIRFKTKSKRNGHNCAKSANIEKSFLDKLNSWVNYSSNVNNKCEAEGRIGRHEEKIDNPGNSIAEDCIERYESNTIVGDDNSDITDIREDKEIHANILISDNHHHEIYHSVFTVSESDDSLSEDLISSEKSSSEIDVNVENESNKTENSKSDDNSNSNNSFEDDASHSIYDGNSNIEEETNSNDANLNQEC